MIKSVFLLPPFKYSQSDNSLIFEIDTCIHTNQTRDMIDYSLTIDRFQYFLPPSLDAIAIHYNILAMEKGK